MQTFFKAIEWLNENIIWGTPMLLLILSVGVYMTMRTGFFQFRRAGKIAKETVIALFKKESVRKSRDEKSISQFQAISTALAATIGTGNIAGVAAAITVGGPGAIFWMWISAFFGMMTAFAENVLGIYYRKRNEKGEWSGGAMYYLEEGLKGKRIVGKFSKSLALLFAFFCVFASLGMGNMTQVNTVSGLLQNSLEPLTGIKIPPLLTGAVTAIIIAVIVFGGVKRIGRVTEKLVPFMAAFYILGTLLIFLLNYSRAGEVIASIFKGAFGLNAIAGGTVGMAIKKTVGMGFRRGVFSNEAGLGSSVIIGAASDVKEPVVQGMWGIFTVFFDTVIGCTLTAFAVLSSGVVDLQSGKAIGGEEGAELVAAAFSETLSEGAGIIVALSTVFFAFSTVIGWSYYGMKSAEYLFGNSCQGVYKLLFVGASLLGSVMELELVWRISDVFNGLMAIPNLIGVMALSGEVICITKNYTARVLKGKSYIPPLYSNYPEIQAEQETSE